MSEWFQQTAGSGALALAIPVAILAGLVSFFSPCVLPLLPGYLSYATGLSGADLATGNPRRGRMLAGAGLFVLGFSVVFVGLGVLSASVSRFFFVNARVFDVVLGIVAILLGLTFMGALDRVAPWLQRDVRVHRVPAVGLAAAPVLGFLFGLGWAPCIGPTLGVILTLAYNETGPRGGLLLGFYSLGLGIPFLVAALAWRRAMGAFAWIRRHQRWVTAIGGGFLIVIGIALLTGWWADAVAWVQIHLVSDFEVSV
ncbi:cytochrome c biogenesis CcdA family protein [Nocardioides sp.]|uniref:cytochrome c biogenesis CcdA family protein n=1 Tax=Nocardioides sp. TaxID=35761 RepID=UPI0035673701